MRQRTLLVERMAWTNTQSRVKYWSIGWTHRDDGRRTSWTEFQAKILSIWNPIFLYWSELFRRGGHLTFTYQTSQEAGLGSRHQWLLDSFLSLACVLLHMLGFPTFSVTQWSWRRLTMNSNPDADVKQFCEFGSSGLIFSSLSWYSSS